MKVRFLFATLFTLTASLPHLALAHPGHALEGLHLHAGAPSASNSLDLRLALGTLVLALGVQGLRSFLARSKR